MTGATVCSAHGGSAPQVRQAAARRVARERAADAAASVGLLGRAGADLTPAEHLMDELHASTAIGAVLAEVVASLDDAGKLWADRTGWAAWEAWADERDRRAKLARLAADLGLADRLVRINERQAWLLAAAMRGVVTDLGHDPADPQVVASVRRRLAEARDTDRNELREVAG